MIALPAMCDRNFIRCLFFFKPKDMEEGGAIAHFSSLLSLDAIALFPKMVAFGSLIYSASKPINLASPLQPGCYAAYTLILVSF